MWGAGASGKAGGPHASDQEWFLDYCPSPRRSAGSPITCPPSVPFSYSQGHGGKTPTPPTA